VIIIKIETFLLMKGLRLIDIVNPF